MKDKIMNVIVIIWLACGLIASGMFFKARQHVEFKTPQIAEQKDGRAREIERLRKEVEALKKAQQ